MEDEVVMGITIHELLRKEEMTLHAYLSAVRHKMWASQIEIHYAAVELGIGIMFMCDDYCVKLGQGRVRFAVRKHKATLHPSQDLQASPRHKDT